MPKSVIKPEILIVGYGSIGAQYEEQLKKFAKNISFVSNRKVSTNHLTREDLKKKQGFYDLIIICSETNSHISDLRLFIDFSDKFLVEKPLSQNYLSALNFNFDTNKKEIFVSSPLRFLNGFFEFKNIIDLSKEILEVEIINTSWLPSWRKRNYKETYSSDPKQGGVLLDCIHEIDLILEYFGFTYTIKSRLNTGENLLGIAVDSSAEINLKSPNRNIRVNLSFENQQLKRQISIKSSEAIIEWDLLQGVICMSNCSKNTSEVIMKFDSLANQRKTWLLSQVKSIFDTNSFPKPLLFNDALYSLKMIDAIKKSSLSGEWLNENLKKEQ